VNDRPETRHQVYDTIHPPSSKHLPNAGPSFFFAFDLSDESISSGFAQMAAASVLSVLPQLSDDAYVGLLTFDGQITIVDLKRNKKFVITDLDAPVYFVNQSKLGAVRTVVTNQLIAIAAMCQTSQPSGNCFGSVLDALSVLLKGIGGLTLVFLSSRPSIGPRSIPERRTQEFESEVSLLQCPEISRFYRQVGLKLSALSVSIHLFVKGDSFVDLSAFSLSVSLTGGRCYLYSDFSIQLHADISRTLTSRYCWNSFLRVKLSRGLSIQRMHGNGVLRDKEVMVMPALSPSETYAFELEVQDNVPADGVVIQFVLEWADDSRRRFARVFTFGFPVSADPADILRHVDEAALAVVLVKRLLQIFSAQGTIAAATSFISQVKKYREMKALLRFGFALANHDFLTRREPLELDEKLVQVMAFRSAGITEILMYCYPRLIAISDLCLKPLKKSSFQQSLMILHCSDAIYLWGLDEDRLVGEVDGAIRADGTVDTDLLAGPNADPIRAIITREWELSLRYLHVFPVTGIESVQRFFVRELGKPRGEARRSPGPGLRMSPVLTVPILSLDLEKVLPPATFSL
jgi:hypothetical protein